MGEFPSLIGRSRALSPIREADYSSTFPSLIGRSRARADDPGYAVPFRVSIPHRKVAGAAGAAHREAEGKVSIPHRKVAGLLEPLFKSRRTKFPSLMGRSRASKSARGLSYRVLVSIPHRKVAGSRGAIKPERPSHVSIPHRKVAGNFSGIRASMPGKSFHPS